MDPDFGPILYGKTVFFRETFLSASSYAKANKL